MAYLRDGQWSLGMLIDAIEKRRRPHKSMNDSPLESDEVHFDFGAMVPAGLHSWRGIYAELAIGFRDANQYRADGTCCPIPAVKDFLEELRGAVGKRFEGYKGGGFVMSRETPLWVSKYGEAHETAVVGLCDDEYCCRIKTAWVHP